MKITPPTLPTVLDWIFTLSSYLFPIVLICLVWFKSELWINITVSNVILLAASFTFHKLSNDSK